MNNKVKDVLVNTVFKAASIFNKIIPKNDRAVLLYSNVGFRDNVHSIYEYMIGNGYTSKYHIIISATNFLPDKVPQNVEVVSNFKGIFKFFTTKHVFYSQGKIPMYPGKDQYVVQMWHGTPFKGNDNRQNKATTNKSYYSHIFSSSPYFEQIIIDNFYVNKENVAICGQPRTDVLFDNNDIPKELKIFDNLILWLPTWRKSSIVGQEDVKQTSVVPVFKIEDLTELEGRLAKLNTGLLIKLHYMQDLDLLKDVHFDHIILLSDLDFQKRGWDLYRIMSKTSALVTDYSSVFYDYMLLDRPLAFAIDDFDEYMNRRGFVVDDPEYFMAGEKIRTKEDFYQFIDHVANGEDPYKEQRNEVNRLTHTYPDGNNCKRALEIGGVCLD